MFSKEVTNRSGTQATQTKDVPKIKRKLRKAILENKMLSQDKLYKSQQDFNKLTEEPGPITYSYDMASIANRTHHQKVACTARSNQVAPFNTRSMRFS